MFKGNVLKLLIGAAILVICYAFPFFMMPVGNYSAKSDNVKIEYSFKWNGKFEANLGDNISGNGYYKLKAKDKEIYVGTTEDVETTALNKLASVKSVYKIKINDTEYTNPWGIAFAVVGYVFAGWGLIGLIVRQKR